MGHGFSKARGEREPEAYPQGYVEDSVEPRTRRDAARRRPLIDLRGRGICDDCVGVGDEPRFVHLAEVGNDRDDRNVLHVRVGASSEGRVVEQRMDRDDDVGLITNEKIAALA